MVDIVFSQNHVQLTIGPLRIVTRFLQGSFINYDSIMPQNFNTSLLINRTALLESLEINRVLSDKINSSVLLNVHRTGLEVTSLTKIGSIVKNVPIKVIGSPIKLAFNLQYLLEGVRAIDEEFIEVVFVGGSRLPAVIQSLTQIILDTSYHLYS